MSDPLHDVYEKIGEHTSLITGLRETCDRIEARQGENAATINTKLDTLMADKHRNEGSKKTFYAIAAGIASAAGAIASAAITYLKTHP